MSTLQLLLIALAPGLLLVVMAELQYYSGNFQASALASVAAAFAFAFGFLFVIIRRAVWTLDVACPLL